MNKFKAYSVIWLVLLFSVIVFGLQGCISTGDIEGIVDKGGKAAGTIILASAGKDLAETRLVKAETASAFVTDVNDAIAKQPLDQQAKLITKVLEVKKVQIDNTYSKGLAHASVFWLFLIVLVIVLRYILNRYFPKPKTIIY